jgi:hypothetical protein
MLSDIQEDLLSLLNISKLDGITLNSSHHSLSSIDNSSLDECNNNEIVTLSAALELTDKGRVICGACHPYPVLYANKAWSKLTKYQQHEISGKSLSLLQGALTDRSAIQVMMHNVQYTGFGQAEVINYRSDGTPFFCSLQIQPISSSDMYGEIKITHLLGTYNIFDIETNIDKMNSLKNKLDDEYSWLIKCDIEPTTTTTTDSININNKRKRQSTSFSTLNSSNVDLF